MDYGTSLQICYCTVERAAGNAAVISHGLAECTTGDFSIILVELLSNVPPVSLPKFLMAETLRGVVARIETCLPRYEEFPHSGTYRIPQMRFVLLHVVKVYSARDRHGAVHIAL